MEVLGRRMRGEHGHIPLASFIHLKLGKIQLLHTSEDTPKLAGGISLSCFP